MDSEMFAKHAHWVVERHRIWLKRQHSEPGPWTGDPILATRKFTNCFRILDPGTQFVFHLAHPDPAEELLRLFLYRSTGSIPAWERAREKLGDYPTRETLDDTLRIWDGFRAEGGTVFTSAYVVYPGPAGPESLGTNKAKTTIRRTESVFADRGEEFLSAESQPARYRALARHRGVAEFISMQTLTDWGYTEHCGEDREHEFIVAGPGSRKGAKLLDPAAKPEDTIRRLRDYWEADGQVYLNLPDGSHRYPSLMDLQNCLCELGKYNRYAPRRRAYAPAHPGAQPAPRYPQHWMKGTAT